MFQTSQCLAAIHFLKLSIDYWVGWGNDLLLFVDSCTRSIPIFTFIFGMTRILHIQKIIFGVQSHFSSHIQNSSSKQRLFMQDNSISISNCSPYEYPVRGTIVELRLIQTRNPAYPEKTGDVWYRVKLEALFICVGGKIIIRQLQVKGKWYSTALRPPCTVPPTHLGFRVLSQCPGVLLNMSKFIFIFTFFIETCRKMMKTVISMQKWIHVRCPG